MLLINGKILFKASISLVALCVSLVRIIDTVSIIYTQIQSAQPSGFTMDIWKQGSYYAHDLKNTGKHKHD